MKAWGLKELVESNVKSAELELQAAIKDLDAARAKVAKITDKVGYWKDAVEHLETTGWKS